MIGSVETIEAWWMVVTGAGVLLMAWMLASAINDELWVKRSGRNGLLRIGSRGSALEAFGLLAAVAMLFTVGAIFATLPPAPPHPITAVELAFDFLMFGASTALTLVGLTGRIKRRKMIAYEEKHGGPTGSTPSISGR